MLPNVKVTLESVRIFEVNRILLYKATIVSYEPDSDKTWSSFWAAKLSLRAKNDFNNIFSSSYISITRALSLWAVLTIHDSLLDSHEGPYTKDGNGIDTTRFGFLLLLKAAPQNPSQADPVWATACEYLQQTTELKPWN